MSNSLASARQVTEGQSPTQDYLPLVGAVPKKAERVSAGNSVTTVDLCSILADAIDVTGARKAAAIAMGISGPVLTKQLTRVEGASPSLGRMAGLPPLTLAEFARRILAAVGNTDPVEEVHASLQAALTGLASAVSALGRVSK